MRTLFIFLAITIVLFCRSAHAQWLQTIFPCDGYTVFSFAVSPNGTSGTNLFAGTGWGGIFLSTNNGTSWTPVNDGLPKNKENHTDYVSVQCFVTSGRNLFAGTGYGVFVSDFHGTSWTAVGLQEISVSALAVSDTNLFAGTDGAGIWRRPLSEMVTSAERLSTNLPTHSTLDQNYPNPFNPATKIQFTLVNPRLPHGAQHGGQGQLTIVKVFDLLGREVATLVNGVKEPGTYTVQFDASDLASGLYLYRIEAGDFVLTKKLMILR